MKQQINEFKRMQLIAGLITESEYRQSLSEEMELPKVGDKFSYEDDEIQITGVDDKFVDAKSTKKNKTYNFGLRSWKEGFKGSKLNEMDEAKETISVSDAKEYADSWDDDDISMDFKKTFSGKDQIAKSDFINFFKKHIDDMSEISDIRSAWDQLLSGEGL